VRAVQTCAVKRALDHLQHGGWSARVDLALVDVGHDLAEMFRREQAIADQWLTQVDNLKKDLAEIRDKAKANDEPGVSAVLPKAQDHNSKTNELAGRLGMSVCNQD